MAPLYEIFARDIQGCTFTEKDLEAAFVLETYGRRAASMGIFESDTNGYIIGKKLLNLAVTEWKTDIKGGILFIEELYDDHEFKDYSWWLDSIFNEEDRGNQKKAIGEYLHYKRRNP